MRRCDAFLLTRICPFPGNCTTDSSLALISFSLTGLTRTTTLMLSSSGVELPDDLMPMSVESMLLSFGLKKERNIKNALEHAAGCCVVCNQRTKGIERGERSGVVIYGNFRRAFRASIVVTLTFTLSFAGFSDNFPESFLSFHDLQLDTMSWEILLLNHTD
jgi:hypothetical protein